MKKNFVIIISLFFISVSLHADKKQAAIILGENSNSNTETDKAKKLQRTIKDLGLAIFDGRKKEKKNSKSRIKNNKKNTSAKHNRQSFKNFQIPVPSLPSMPSAPKIFFGNKQTNNQTVNQNINQENNHSKNSVRKNKVSKHVPLKSFKAEIVFGNEKKWTGSIYLSPEKIYVEHIKNGHLFGKSITVSQIKTIVIQKWKKKIIKKNKLGSLYSFQPESVEIHLKNNLILNCLKLPASLKSFSFKHRLYGRTNLYTNFADLKKNNGLWRDRQTTSENENLKTAHPDAVKKIYFLNQ